MKVEKFKQLLQGNNAIKITDDLIIFNDFELYSFETEQSKRYRTIEELMNDNPDIKELIESKDVFEQEYDGGRGSSSGSTMGMKFGGYGAKNNHEKMLPAELNLKESGGNSQQAVMKRFLEKYGNANREYAIAIDENGYVYQHIKGAKHEVGIEGDKGQTIIHNHPSGSNFSGADLENVATTKAKGIVATSSNKETKGTYSFSKTDKFKAKEFVKAIHKASWSKDLGYNKGLDQWLRKNQKTYGYKYSARGVKNADW